MAEELPHKHKLLVAQFMIDNADPHVPDIKAPEIVKLNTPLFQAYCSLGMKLRNRPLVKGAGKGSEFERKTCATLSKWVTQGKADDLFSRNVLSGGQFTQAAKSGKRKGHAGDIIAQRPEGFALTDRFVLECKHWRTLDMLAFLWQRGELFPAVQKTHEQAKSCNKSWIFFAQENFRDTLVIFPYHIFIEQSWTKIVLPFETVYVTNLPEFLQRFSFEAFMRDIGTNAPTEEEREERPISG